MYAFLRKYLLPKEILKLQEETQKLKEQVTNLKKVDPGYEVISWWGPSLLFLVICLVIYLVTKRGIPPYSY